MGRILLLLGLVLSVAACGGDSGNGGGGGNGGPEDLGGPGSAAVKRAQLYEHMTGFRFHYPEGWKVEDVGEALSLVPPDLRKNADGPMEAMFVLGAPHGGISDPADPRMVSQVDMLVRSQFPFLAKEGDAVKNGRSAEVTWAGKAPTGFDAKARMWITIMRDMALGVAIVVPAEDFDKRAKTAKAISDSIDWKAPKVDRTLVGLWRNESTYISGEFSSVTVKHMGLSADGRATWGGKMMAGMSHFDNGGNFTGSTSAEGSGAESTGRWHAKDGKLLVQWDDNTVSEWKYYIEGTSMMLTPTDGGKRKVWEKVK